ncbi:MAG: DUF4255 domain-containing protein [Deltaproteobacteria bacterium]|nr:DUF4255 domain-containing protein [Deltaproteobacteria bacterium]
MSSHEVLYRVSAALRDVIHKGLDGKFVANENEITFTDPGKTSSSEDRKLSLWLYQVTENEFVKNQPPVRSAKVAQGEELPPLALNLFYLVTPFTGGDQNDLHLLGKVMEILHNNNTITLNDPVNDLSEELHVLLCRLTLEELTRIWEARREPYRLSVCYEVRVTRIRGVNAPERARIAERDAGFGQKPRELAS